MIAIEAAARWGSRGALFGGVLAGGLAVTWASVAYDAVGRQLPPASIAFRLLSMVVIALPVGLIIERLRRQQQYTRRLFESSADAIVIVNEGRVVAANPSALTLARVTPDDLVGRPFGERLGPLLEIDDLDGLLHGGTTPPPPVPHVGVDGRQRWLAVSAESTEARGPALVTIRDVTVEREREQALRFHAWHDPLTGLPNRAALQSRLASRLGEPPRLGVVFLDLDGFKDVNDRFGHVAGDDLLVEVADRLRQATRQTDAAYRWAGDEFCLVVDPADDPTLAAVAERIGQAFAQGFRVGGDAVRIRASVGTALSRPGDSEALLVARADAVMYEAKYRDRRRRTR